MSKADDLKLYPQDVMKRVGASSLAHNPLAGFMAQVLAEPEHARTQTFRDLN